MKRMDRYRCIVILITVNSFVDARGYSFKIGLGNWVEVIRGEMGQKRLERLGGLAKQRATRVVYQLPDDLDKATSTIYKENTMKTTGTFY